MQSRKTSYLLSTFLLVTVMVAGRMIVHYVPFYDTILKTYALLLGNTSALLLNLTGHPATYDLSADLLALNTGKGIAIQHHLALKFYVYLLLILLPLTARKLQSILLFIAGTFILFAVAVTRNVALVMVNETTTHLVMALSYLARFSLLWLAVMYRIRIHPQLTSLYQTVSQRFNERFHLSPATLLYLIFVATSVMSLIDMFLIQSDSSFSAFMSTLILSLSETIFRLMNYQVVIDGNYIWLGNVWVFLGSPCLGIGVMTLFTSLILIIRSKWINKLIYILFGLVFLTLMNALRVVYILVHLYKNGDYTLNLEAHDLSNYFFYSVVFALLMIYIYWFQDINFKIKSKWRES